MDSMQWLPEAYSQSYIRGTKEFKRRTCHPPNQKRFNLEIQRIIKNIHMSSVNSACDGILRAQFRSIGQRAGFLVAPSWFCSPNPRSRNVTQSQPLPRIKGPVSLLWPFRTTFWTTTMSAPYWEPGTAYKPGDVVQYEGKLRYEGPNHEPVLTASRPSLQDCYSSYLSGNHSFHPVISCIHMHIHRAIGPLPWLQTSGGASPMRIKVNGVDIKKNTNSLQLISRLQNVSSNYPFAVCRNAADDLTPQSILLLQRARKLTFSPKNARSTGTISMITGRKNSRFDLIRRPLSLSWNLFYTIDRRRVARSHRSCCCRLLRIQASWEERRRCDRCSHLVWISTHAIIHHRKRLIRGLFKTGYMMLKRDSTNIRNMDPAPQHNGYSTEAKIYLLMRLL